MSCLRALSLPAFLLALALLGPLAAADDGCEPSTSEPEVDTGDLAGTGVGTTDTIGRWYVDSDHERCAPFGDECLFSVWIYPEANGQDGLQRGDEMKDDTCGGQTESDTILP